MRFIYFLLFISMALSLQAQNKPVWGSEPYKACFGYSLSCLDGNCSYISVTPSKYSDVVVSVKQNGKVVAHAYIPAGMMPYTFKLPNGWYQVFFYSGLNWSTTTKPKGGSCNNMYGAFTKNASVGKDDPEYLNNAQLNYELIQQPNGNFNTKGSNLEEAF